MSKKLFLSAGDLSGDVHCAMLVRELLARHPEGTITALGGKAIREAGAQLLGDTSELGVIGFASALAILPQTLRLKSLALKWLRENKPDAIILCDWGGFNGRLLPDLKRLGIPVLYYFPPRSWQKKGEGGLKIAPFCEQIATPFQWSAQRLNGVGGHAEWVGHPILERMKLSQDREALRRDFGVAPGQKLIALLPGSRALERKFIAPHVAGAVKILQKNGDARFVVAATTGTTSRLRTIFGDSVSIVENRTSDLLLVSDGAIVKSGTSTLEAAVAGVPQVVVYEAPALIHFQIRLTGLKKKIPFVAMPNIILDRLAIPEMLGENCRAAKIAETLTNILDSPAEMAQMRADYALVRGALGADLPYTATKRTADLVEQVVA